MQVSPVTPTVAAAVAGRAELLLLPDLLNVTRLSPQTQAVRQQRQADRDERDRRRHQDDAAQQLAAAADTGTCPTPAELTIQAEREMAPGSRAARRQLATHDEQRALLQRNAFQRTLVDAAAHQNVSAGHAKAATSSPTDGECQPTEPDAPQPAPSARATAAAPANQVSSATAVISAENASPPAPAAAGAVADARQVSAVAVQTSVSSAAAPSLTPPQTGDTGAAPISIDSVSGAANALKTTGTATPTLTAASDTTAPQSKAGHTNISKAAAEAPQGETGKSDANFERILRVLRAQISHKHSQTILQLDPPELGKVRLHLDLREDALSLRVEPHTHLAYRLLSEHVHSLRDGLHATGVHLEHVEIRPPEANAAPEGFDLPPHSGGGHAGGGAQAETDHPQHPGTDSPAAGPPETAGREANSQPAAEPRVNVWA